MNELQVVVFGLNNEICGADTSQVQEIVKYQEVTKVPDVPEYVDGIINLRGNVVPVVNLNRKFNLGQGEINKKTKIIISNIDSRFIGFVVNEVSEIVKLSGSDIENAPDLINRSGHHYIQCVGKKGEQLISILDLKSILSGNEMEFLGEKHKTA